MAASFLSAFVVCAGLLALWIDARFPNLAPESLSKRVLAACCTGVIFGAAPVFSGSAAAVYTTLFAIVLPLLVASLLATVWVLRSLRDAQVG